MFFLLLLFLFFLRKVLQNKATRLSIRRGAKRSATSVLFSRAVKMIGRGGLAPFQALIPKGYWKTLLTLISGSKSLLCSSFLLGERGGDSGGSACPGFKRVRSWGKKRRRAEVRRRSAGSGPRVASLRNNGPPEGRTRLRAPAHIELNYLLKLEA